MSIDFCYIYVAKFYSQIKREKAMTDSVVALPVSVEQVVIVIRQMKFLIYPMTSAQLWDEWSGVALDEIDEREVTA
jgi:hypothetical protein